MYFNLQKTGCGGSSSMEDREIGQSLLMSQLLLQSVGEVKQCLSMKQMRGFENGPEWKEMVDVLS